MFKSKSIPKHMEVALSYMGQKEIPGNDHNLTIVSFFQYVTYNATDDETPWCGTFMGAVCQIAHGIPPDICVRARAWLEWGEEVGQPYRGEDAGHRHRP